MFSQPTPKSSRRAHRAPSLAPASPSPAPSQFLRQSSQQPSRLGANDEEGTIRGSEYGLSRIETESMIDEQREQQQVGGTLLVRDDRYAVTSFGVIPREVELVLSSADLYTTPLRATLSPTTSFLTVTTLSHLYISSFVSRTVNAHAPYSPTCYVLPLPRPTPSSQYSPIPSLCQTILVKHSGGREPGVLAVSPSGEVRYWDEVGSALVEGGRRWTAGEVNNLADGEEVTGVEEIDSGLYLVTSTYSLYLLTLTYPAGRPSLTCQPFTKPSSLLSRLFSNSSTISGSDKIFAYVLGPSVSSTPGRDLWVVVGNNLQRWNVVKGGLERLTTQQSLLDPISDALFIASPPTEESYKLLELEILSIALLPPSTAGSRENNEDLVAVLVSYYDDLNKLSGLGPDQVPRKSFAVVVCSLGGNGIGVGGSCKVVRIVRCTHKAFADPRPLPSPKLAIPPHQPWTGMSFIILPTDIIILSLSPKDPYEESFSLKSTSENAFLGIGLDSVTQTNGIARSYVMTRASGVLEVQVLTDSAGVVEDVSGRGLDRSTRRLKNKLEQAVFFGNRPENPLSFALSASFIGNLSQASSIVSSEILSSNSFYLNKILDLRSQISDRIAKLDALVNFISENGLLGGLNQSVRRTLMWNSEKLAAGAELWNYQNQKLAEVLAYPGTGNRRPASLLGDSIVSFLVDTGLGMEEDPVRFFFRHKLDSLGSVLVNVFKSMKQTIEHSSSTEAISQWLLEANRVILVALKAALRYREVNSNSYGVERTTSPSEPWTSTSSMIDALEFLVLTTEKLIHQRSLEFGSSLDEDYAAFGNSLSEGQSVQKEFKEQLCDLAAALFSSFEDRIRFLNTVRDGTNDRDAFALRDRYLDVRPRVILPLVKIGQASRAFQLAEHHQDFRSLVELCNIPEVGTPAKTQYYIDQFQHEFTVPLYEYYIQKNQLHTLLSQDEIYSKLLSDFFLVNDYSRIAWMHSIATKDFGDASEFLFQESQKEDNLRKRKLIVSIGKLSQVVSMTNDGHATEADLAKVDRLDDQLDLMSVHEKLRALFELTFSNKTGVSRMSIETKAQIARQELASGLESRPAMLQLFLKLAQDLLQGKYLSVEDLVDLMTLKDNRDEEQIHDFASAMDVLRRAELPEGRSQFAVQTIWRRVYIRDDWTSLRNTTNYSDEQVSQLLQDTALFATFKSLQALTDMPTVAPLQARLGSVSEEVAARFTSATAEEVNMLVSDYAMEDSILAQSIEAGNLSELAVEVQRMSETIV